MLPFRQPESWTWLEPRSTTKVIFVAPGYFLSSQRGLCFLGALLLYKYADSVVVVEIRRTQNLTINNNSRRSVTLSQKYHTPVLLVLIVDTTPSLQGERPAAKPAIEHDDLQRRTDDCEMRKAIYLPIYPFITVLSCMRLL